MPGNHGNLRREQKMTNLARMLLGVTILGWLTFYVIMEDAAKKIYKYMEA